MSICGDLIDSGQWRLFWGRMWICVSVCEYLVIWCDKTTVHEIIDSSSSISTQSASRCKQMNCALFQNYIKEAAQALIFHWEYGCFPYQYHNM
jgi:hypothetical protein